jgi:Flp pilus assembly secretin CpaC
LSITLFASFAFGADEIRIVVGQDLALNFDSVKTVSLGLPIAKIDVRPLSSEILITAISSGKSTMTIWDEFGHQEVRTLIILDYDVNDIKRLVKDTGASVEVIGSKIVLRGQLGSAADKERIQNVIRSYDKIIDQTQIKVEPIVPNRPPNIIEVENLIGLPEVKLKVSSDSKVAFLDGLVASETEQSRALRIAESYFEKVVNLLEVVKVKAIEPESEKPIALNSKLTELLRTRGAELEVDRELLILKGEVPSSDEISELQQIVSAYSSKPIINALRRSKKMVEIDVTIVEIASSKLKELKPPKFGFNSEVKIEGALPLKSPKAQYLNLSYSASAALWPQINSMIGKGYARILARPKVVAMSGEKAKFLVGGSIPIRLYDVYGGSTVQWKEHGIKLTLEPRLDQNGAMSSRVEVEVSSLDWANQVDGIPALSTRSVETNIWLKPSESAIIAGLIQKNKSENLNRTPIVGYIPILNWLFRSKTSKEDESELVIIIMPHTPTSNLTQYDKINSDLKRDVSDVGR